MKNEETKKKAHHFNFVDALLLLAVIGITVGLIYIFASDRVEVVRRTPKESELLYEITVSQARLEYKGLLQIGDQIRDSRTQSEIGEVVNVVYSEASMIGYAPDGSAVVTPHPERIQMVITVKATAQAAQDGTYQIGNGYTLLLGDTVSFCADDFVQSGICTSLKEATENE